MRIVLLSLFWAICSTCLINPFFWKCVKSKKKFFKIKADKYCDILTFLGVFWVSIQLYLTGTVQTILYFFPFVLIICTFKLLYSFVKNSNVYIKCLIVIIGTLCATITISDTYLISKTVSPVQNPAVPASMLTVATPRQIESTFNLTHVDGPYYNNNRFIYVVKRNEQSGIVVIHQENKDVAELIPSLYYETALFDLRTKYPTSTLKEVGITVSDENTPYSLFVTLSKKHLSSAYQIDKYVMVNLSTGESNEFDFEELPSFVMNNN